MTLNKSHLIWIDLEMTGLKVNQDVILEIATVITDSNLQIIEEGPSLAIHQPEEVLAGMDAWNTSHHKASGLVERVRQSHLKVAEAEQHTLSFLQRHVPPGCSPMCGNSICQDRRFLFNYMPTLEKYFHYRNLDVSTIKILAQRWAPKFPKFNKVSQHLALEDIRDSIQELAYYRENFFINSREGDTP